MATVRMYTIAPQVRRPEEVMRVLSAASGRKGSDPAPAQTAVELGKRREASSKPSEKLARDPLRKSWVVLVDGHQS